MDRTIEKIIELLTSSVKTQRGIKEIYNGDPFLIPLANFPAITISRLRERVITADTQKDEDAYSVGITLMTDSRKTINPATSEYDPEIFLSKTIGEKNVDFTFKSDTIMGVIRQQLYCLDGYNLETENENVQYGITERGIGEGDRVFPTLFASISLDVISIPYNRTP